ncbi:MAG: ABC transporter ATP-binding protein [Planctomycetota bacterium]
MPFAIETRGLTRYFGDFCAVQAVDLKVEKGCLYGFLGPNGAGKSTTIKMLTGILKPTEGAAQLLDLNPWDQDQAIEIKKRTGVVPEDLALFDNLTASEYLAFVGQMYSMDRQTIESRSEELIKLLKLENAGSKLSVEFSHGMKKKLALAAALLPNPDLLFLDEPFEGVDAVTARVIRDLLANFVGRGSTVFVTSHVLEIVERICTHVGVIANGQLVEQASLAELRKDKTLEKTFLELVGETDEQITNVSWLDSGANSKSVSDDNSDPFTSDDKSNENSDDPITNSLPNQSECSRSSDSGDDSSTLPERGK